jgi:hypothetical protein
MSVFSGDQSKAQDVEMNAAVDTDPAVLNSDAVAGIAVVNASADAPTGEEGQSKTEQQES